MHPSSSSSTSAIPKPGAINGPNVAAILILSICCHGIDTPSYRRAASNGVLNFLTRLLDVSTVAGQEHIDPATILKVEGFPHGLAAVIADEEPGEDHRHDWSTLLRLAQRAQNPKLAYIIYSNVLLWLVRFFYQIEAPSPHHQHFLQSFQASIVNMAMQQIMPAQTKLSKLDAQQESEARDIRLATKIHVHLFVARLFVNEFNLKMSKMNNEKKLGLLLTDLWNGLWSPDELSAGISRQPATSSDQEQVQDRPQIQYQPMQLQEQGQEQPQAHPQEDPIGSMSGWLTTSKINGRQLAFADGMLQRRSFLGVQVRRIRLRWIRLDFKERVIAVQEIAKWRQEPVQSSSQSANAGNLVYPAEKLNAPRHDGQYGRGESDLEDRVEAFDEYRKALWRGDWSATREKLSKFFDHASHHAEQ